MPRILRSYISRRYQQPIAGPLIVPGTSNLPTAFLASFLHGSIYDPFPRIRWYASVVGQLSGHIGPSAQRLGSHDQFLRVGQRWTGSFYTYGKWLALLDLYLPAALRSATASPPFLKIGSRFPFAVPNILRRARGESNFDLLSYVGIGQGRWKAVHWLVGNLVQPVTAHTEISNATPLPSQIHWESDMTLDDATQSPVWTDHVARPKGLKNTKPSSLHDLTGRAVRPSWMSDPARDLALRQIWQSIGFMILQAADLPEDKSRTIMSNVQQIIAHLHHVGAVPDTIYSYPYAIDPSVPQRPPTLYLLSTRILTTLSDAVWRAQEEAITTEVAAVGAEFPYKGYGNPSSRRSPRLRDLGHAVWLEFVLWSCVETGYVVEGAWLLNELGRRRGDDRWFTTHWSALQEPPSYGTAMAVRVGWLRSMFLKTVGTSEGYSNEDPLVQMGPRTVSTEVVVALIDGLLSTVRVGFGSTGNTPGQVQDHIYSLKAVLERDNFRLPARVWNSIIVRLLESQKMDPEMDPASLERVLALAPTTLRDRRIEGLQADPDSVPSVAENVLNQSNAMLGLLHRTLHAFALQGNIRGARRVYMRIQSYIINWRTDTKSAFITSLRPSMHTGDESIYFDAEFSDISDYMPDVPEPVLAAFIDLITDAKAYDLGRWLLYSDETGGSVIRFFSSVTVAPALLRFAAATSDSDLLNKVISALVVPLPENIIRTMFQCHIALSDWDGVEKLLLYFKDERNLGWGATEAAALARAVILLDNTASEETKSFDKAKVILRKLLHGHFNTAQLAYERRDNMQVNLLSQLIRIFRTIPGVLGELCQDLPGAVIQPSQSVDIPVNAFNILLDAVVSTKGSLEGRRMWYMWCKNPGVRSRNAKSGTSNIIPGQVRLAASPVSMNGHHPEHIEMGGVVQPNLTTLRTILQAAITERKASIEVAARYFGNNLDGPVPNQLPTYRSYRPSEILDWGSSLLRRFGLRETSVDAELGGYLYRQKRPFVREGQTLAERGQRLNKKIRSSARYNRFLARKSRYSTGENLEANRPRPER